jgi:lipopolysaccharide export system permease protein
MTIIDRYLLRQFAHNFVVCFVSLMGVYVVLDMFGNLNGFLECAHGLELLKLMSGYYGYQSLFFFDRFSALLVLMSAMFTMAWIQRHHEMTALMAAGISRIRVATPVMIAAVALTLLSAANRELLIPRIKDQLSRRPSELKGNVYEELLPQSDYTTNVLLRGSHVIVDQKKIELPEFLPPNDRTGRELCAYGKAWTAAVAQYLPAGDGHPAGYLLQDVYEPKGLAAKASLALGGRPVLMTPRDYPAWLKPNEAFMVSDVTIDELVGGVTIRRFLSTSELIWGLKRGSIYFSPELRVAIHARIVQPFLDITLLFLGLPLVVARDNRNVFVAIGMCFGLVGLYFLVSIVCQQLGSNLWISPALAAWAPLMAFVPAAVGLAAPMWER